MIIISLLGVDQYQAASFVQDIQEQTAQAFECDPEDILFYAPDSFLIYKGVDQTSYQLNIVVQAPCKYKPLENQAANFLIKVFSQNHVHVRVLFQYFEKENEHEYVNPDYPRYMTENNMAHFEHIEEEDENTKPYMGNAFADYDQRVKEHEQEEMKTEKERQNTRKKDN